MIPDAQEYYWTDAWQAGELESLAELAAGGGETFESWEAAIRFLFETESD